MVQKGKEAGVDRDPTDMSVRSVNIEEQRIKMIFSQASFFSGISWIRNEWNSEAYTKSLNGLKYIIEDVEKKLVNSF